MNLEGIMQSEISQREKGKHYVVSFICGIGEKKSQIQKQSRKVDARHWRIKGEIGKTGGKLSAMR